MSLFYLSFRKSSSWSLSLPDDKLSENNIWLIWSRASYSGDKWRCHHAGRTNNNQRKCLLSYWILKAEFRNKRQLVLNLPLLYLLGNSQGKWIKVKKLTQLNSFANFLTKSAETTCCELEIKNCFIEYA